MRSATVLSFRNHLRSKFQSGSARRVGKGLDSAVIQEAVAIEDNLVDAELEATLRNRLSDHRRRCAVVHALEARLQRGTESRQRRKRAPGLVGYDLTVDM